MRLSCKYGNLSLFFFFYTYLSETQPSPGQTRSGSCHVTASAHVPGRRGPCGQDWISHSWQSRRQHSCTIGVWDTTFVFLGGPVFNYLFLFMWSNSIGLSDALSHLWQFYSCGVKYNRCSVKNSCCDMDSLCVLLSIPLLGVFDIHPTCLCFYFQNSS